MKVKIKKVKSPLKKYKKIIDEIQLDQESELSKKTFNDLARETEVALINGLVVKNGLDQDLLVEVFNCTPKVYARFFTNSLDEYEHSYMLKKFSLLFRCKVDAFGFADMKSFTFVPKWCDNYLLLRLYMIYNGLYLFLYDLWWNMDD